MAERRDPRHPVDIEGRYRHGTGSARHVIVRDLSVNGCSMFDRFSNLEAGAELSVRIGSIGPIDAVVKWRSASVVGIEFVTPLHPSVLEHMRSTIEN